MESRITPERYLAAFLAILEDISVKISRGGACPWTPPEGKRQLLCFKLTPPALINFSPPKWKYTKYSIPYSYSNLKLPIVSLLL